MVHDLNNLLTVMNGCNEMLLTSCQLPEKARQCVTAARDAGQRATSLARAMMVINHRTTAEPKRIDINTLVNELTALAQSLLPPDVELVTELGEELRPVFADRWGILQVLLNLVLNSRDAMPEGGQVKIATANLHSDEAFSAVHPLLPEGDYILLTVSDNGMGMDEATRQRIFEPFYTTKPAGRGSGLGLFTVQQVVKQSGGFLSVKSAKWEGTTVRIYLPATDGETRGDRAQSAETSLHPAEGSETILIAEDDDDLRNLMRDVLERSGYAVLDGGSASEAAEISQGLKGHIDLLVADMALPDSSGKELADCLRESRPGLPVLYVSGCAEHTVGDILAKPFAADELERSVRAILDRHKRKRILIVDDEPLVLMFMGEALRAEGYDVLVAEDGNVVSSIVERERLDLVITDLVMREREGLETMMDLQKSHPKLPVIVMSGAFGGHFLRNASMLGASATLAKPFSGEDLLNAVRTVLED